MDEKREIRDALAGLKVHLQGYTERTPQLRLIGAVALTIARSTAGTKESLAANAGTGCGKSCGLALPAIIMAKRRGLKVIISSSTTTLQQQLLSKDLPALAKAIPGGFTAAISKGRARYVCPARLDAAVEGKLDFEGAGSAGAAIARRLQAAWRSGDWDGDRDSLKESMHDRDWEPLTTTSKGCARSVCRHSSKCPYHLARAAALEVQVVVVNHDQLVCAAQAPDGAILPPLEQSVLVVDEAHALPRVGIEQFAARHRLRAAAKWLRGLPGEIQRVAESAGASREAVAALTADAGTASSLMNRLSNALSARGFASHGPHRFAHGVVPAGLARTAADLQLLAGNLRDNFESMRRALISPGTTDAEIARESASALGRAESRLDAILSVWRLIANSDDPVAKWVERDGDDFAVCACAIDPASKLHDLLWTRAAAVVTASATLTACGSFDAFVRESGLDRVGRVRTIRLDSPFDYASRGTLVVPKMRCSPKDVEGHTRELVDLLPKYLSPRGSLVLFASKSQLDAVVGALPERVRNRMLVQGSVGRGALVAEHKRRIAHGEQSILVGLRGLGEGVDLPGAECDAVLIAKVAFGVPTDPIQEARAEYIEAGGDSAFDTLVLPEASRDLAQKVGRLLRCEGDSGQVVIFDSRLVQARWGRRLLEGLPPFKLELCA